MSLSRQAGERFRNVICEKVVGLEDLRLDSSRSENDTHDLYTKRLEQIQFRDMYTKALERGVINLSSSDDIKVMIHAMKKKVKSAKEKSVIISAVRQIGVFAHHPQIFAQETATTLLFREIKYAFLPKRTVIFNQGDIGDTYYMIIKGEVYCLVPTAKNEIKPIIDEKRKKKKGLGLLSSNSTVNNSHENNSSSSNNLIHSENNIAKLLDCTDEVFLAREYPQFKSVKVFGNWEGFGDIALITQQYRTATMLCKEDTHLICLTKSGFDKIIGEISRQQKITQVKFLKQFTFFSAIPKYKLMSILMDIEIMQCAKNKVLYKEGDPIENVYMILEGEVEISKKHSVDRQEANVVKQFEKTELMNNNSLNTSLVYKQQAINTRHIGLTIIGPNSYCGIDDLFNHKTIRETTAQCITNGVIYSLNKDKFLDSLRVNKQFDRYNTVCIEKDKLMSSRAQEIAYYIDKLTNKFILTQDPAAIEEKFNEQLNHKEKSRRILTNPRDIIKERIFLGKEILAERAIKLAKLHALQEEKKRIKSQEILEEEQALENEFHLENANKKNEQFRKLSGKGFYCVKSAVVSKDINDFGSQNVFSRKTSTPLQGAAYQSTSTKRIISNRNIGSDNESHNDSNANRSNGSFVVENCEIEKNQDNSGAAQELAKAETQSAAHSYHSTPGITSTSASNTQGNYSQPDMSLNDQIQEEYGGQQRIQQQQPHKSLKNLQSSGDSSYLISDFSRSSSAFQKSRLGSPSFVLKKQFIKNSSLSPQKDQKFRQQISQKQISQDENINNVVAAAAGALEENKNEQKDRLIVSENLQTQCLRLLSQEAMETRVDSCELNNFERISRDYPHLKKNSVLKQFLATHVDGNIQKELNKKKGAQTFMRQFNSAVKAQLDYVKLSQEGKLQREKQKKNVSSNDSSNFFKLQNQGNNRNGYTCDNNKTQKIPYYSKEMRMRIENANQDNNNEKDNDQNDMNKSSEKTPQDGQKYQFNNSSISGDDKKQTQQGIQHQSCNDSSYLVQKCSYFITSEKQQLASKQLFKITSEFPSKVEQSQKHQEHQQNEQQQVGIIISQNHGISSSPNSGFRKRTPFKSPLDVFENLLQKRLTSNNSKNALHQAGQKPSPNNRSGRVIHQNLSLNEQFHRLNSTSSIASFGRKTRQASPSPSAIEGSYLNTKRNNTSLLLDFSLENSPKQPQNHIFQDSGKHTSLADQVLEDGQNDDAMQTQQNGSFLVSTFKLLGQKKSKSPLKNNYDENNRSTPSPVLCAKSRSYYYLPVKSTQQIQHRQKGLLRNSLQRDKQLNK